MEGAYHKRDSDTDRLQKSVHMYIFVFTSVYTHIFASGFQCYSSLILVDSGLIPVYFGHSCRHRRGTVKCWKYHMSE